jgi:hypothetical protein
MPSNLATSQQQRGMPNFMPLVHQARRTIRERDRGNPFATDDSIRREIDRLTAAYLATPQRSGRPSPQGRTGPARNPDLSRPISRPRPGARCRGSGS